MSKLTVIACFISSSLEDITRPKEKPRAFSARKLLRMNCDLGFSELYCKAVGCSEVLLRTDELACTGLKRYLRTIARRA